MENEKKQVVIEVRDKIARLADETLKLVCGNSDYEVIFDFDGDWGVDTEKTAYFVYNYDTVPVIFKGNKVDGVAIHMASLLSIGVSEGDIKTTTPAEIPMLECITDRVGKCINIPESLYNQLMVHINELYNKSGIIDVTELPTENINESALYRVSEASAEVYIVRQENEVTTIVTLEESLIADGVSSLSITKRIVDVLPTLPDSSVETLTADNTTVSGTLCILESTGVAYLTTDGASWVPISSVIGGTDKGWASSKDEIDVATLGGIWCVKTNVGGKLSHYTNGNWSQLAETKDIEFSPEDAGKFLIVGEDGKIAVSPVSVGSPIVVTDAATMDAILVNATEADIGKVYLYQGETTANYENGALYGIEAV